MSEGYREGMVGLPATGSLGLKMKSGLEIQAQRSLELKRSKMLSECDTHFERVSRSQEKLFRRATELNTGIECDTGIVKGRNASSILGAAATSLAVETTKI